MADVLPTSQRTDVDDVDVINRVASEATSAELSPDFHARVMARIEARRPPYAAWTLVAAAGAAIIAIVIVHPWQRQTAPTQSTVAETRPAVEGVVTSPSPSPSPIDTTVAESRSRIAERAPVFTPQVPALPPIDPIEPITRESIQPTRLSIPQLTLEPIVMPAVDDDGSIRERR